MCPNLQFPGDLVTFTGGILHGKLDFCPVLPYHELLSSSLETMETYY